MSRVPVVLPQATKKHANGGDRMKAGIEATFDKAPELNVGL